MAGGLDKAEQRRGTDHEASAQEARTTLQAESMESRSGSRVGSDQEAVVPLDKFDIKVTPAADGTGVLDLKHTSGKNASLVEKMSVAGQLLQGAEYADLKAIVVPYRTDALVVDRSSNPTEQISQFKGIEQRREQLKPEKQIGKADQMNIRLENGVAEISYTGSKPEAALRFALREPNAVRLNVNGVDMGLVEPLEKRLGHKPSKQELKEALAQLTSAKNERPESAPAAEKAAAPDIAPAPEKDAAPDIAAAPEKAAAPDIAPAPEKAVAPDIAPAPDKAAAPDIAPAPDKAAAPDIAPAPDKAAAPESAPAKDKAEEKAPRAKRADKASAAKESTSETTADAEKPPARKARAAEKSKQAEKPGTGEEAPTEETTVRKRSRQGRGKSAESTSGNDETAKESKAARQRAPENAIASGKTAPPLAIDGAEPKASRRRTRAAAPATEAAPTPSPAAESPSLALAGAPEAPLPPEAKTTDTPLPTNTAANGPESKATTGETPAQLSIDGADSGKAVTGIILGAEPTPSELLEYYEKRGIAPPEVKLVTIDRASAPPEPHEVELYSELLLWNAPDDHLKESEKQPEQKPLGSASEALPSVLIEDPSHPNEHDTELAAQNPLRSQDSPAQAEPATDSKSQTEGSQLVETNERSSTGDSMPNQNREKNAAITDRPMTTFAVRNEKVVFADGTEVPARIVNIEGHDGERRSHLFIEEFPEQKQAASGAEQPAADAVQAQEQSAKGDAKTQESNVEKSSPQAESFRQALGYTPVQNADGTVTMKFGGESEIRPLDRKGLVERAGAIEAELWRRPVNAEFEGATPGQMHKYTFNPPQEQAGPRFTLGGVPVEIITPPLARPGVSDETAAIQQREFVEQVMNHRTQEGTNEPGQEVPAIKEVPESAQPRERKAVAPSIVTLMRGTPVEYLAPEIQGPYADSAIARPKNAAEIESNIAMYSVHETAPRGYAELKAEGKRAISAAKDRISALMLAAFTAIAKSTQYSP